MLMLMSLAATEWVAERLIEFHNDFMRKYRQAQKEGRL